MGRDYDEPDALSKMDIPEVMEELGLPELPDTADDGPKELVISRFRQEKITLIQGVSESDAQAYCSDDATHGDGWFVLYREF